MTRNEQEPPGNSDHLFGRLRSYHYTTPARQIHLVFHSYTSVKPTNENWIMNIPNNFLGRRRRPDLYRPYVELGARSTGVI